MYILRIISAQAVLVGHCFSWLNITALEDESYFPYIQNYGVVILFILAGFFLMYSIDGKIHNPSFGWLAFLRQRSLRIYLPYIAALLFTLIVDLFVVKIAPQSYYYYDAFNLKTLAGNALMLQDFYGLNKTVLSITSFGSNRPLWTIAIQWWTFLAFGYWILVILRDMKKNSIKGKQLIFFLFLSWVPVNNLGGTRGNGIVRAFVIGCIIYKLFPSININKKLIIPSIYITLALLLVISFTFRDAYNFMSVMLVGSIILLLLKWGELHPEYNPNPLVKSLSSYTYSLYLTHYVVGNALIVFTRNLNPYIQLIIVFTIANLVGYIFALVFERPSFVNKG